VLVNTETGVYHREGSRFYGSIGTFKNRRLLGAFSTVLAKAVSAIDSNGRTIWIADAHRGDGNRFVVRADEKLTAFMELKSAIRVDTK
jgi:hypothetical protein